MWDFIRRSALMLFLALPTGAVALTVFERLRHGRSEDFLDLLGGAFFLVYVWGGVTGILLSVVHTMATSGRSPLLSIVLGVLLGFVAGALTPTFATGLLHPPAILLGGLIGGVYAVLVSVIIRP